MPFARCISWSPPEPTGSAEPTPNSNAQRRKAIRSRQLGLTCSHEISRPSRGKDQHLVAAGRTALGPPQHSPRDAHHAHVRDPHAESDKQPTSADEAAPADLGDRSLAGPVLRPGSSPPGDRHRRGRRSRATTRTPTAGSTSRRASGRRSDKSRRRGTCLQPPKWTVGRDDGGRAAGQVIHWQGDRAGSRRMWFRRGRCR